MHTRFTSSMVYTLTELLPNIVYIPDSTWNTIIRYGDKWDSQKLNKFFGDNYNVRTISVADFADSNIDLVISPCLEQQQDIIDYIIKPYGDRFKYCSYYGNEYHPGMIPWQYFKNHLSADIQSAKEALSYNVHAIEIRPPIKYEDYPFSFSHTNIINSYIHYYANSWRNSYPIYEAVTNSYKNAKWKLYGRQQYGNEDYVDELELPKRMIESVATCHIKEKEGYGMAVIESMALGRPIIAYRPLITPKRLSEWVTDDTSILFDGYDELAGHLGIYLSDADYRMKLQSNCSRVIKNLIDPSVQAIQMKAFLENLR